MKKTKYIFAAVAMLLLLIVISNPEWKSKKNNLQDKDRNIEIETQNLIEEKTATGPEIITNRNWSTIFNA